MSVAKSPKPRAAIAAIPAHPHSALPAPPPGALLLNTNENRFGPSPAVYAALRQDPAAMGLNDYPPAEAAPLNAALARQFGFEAHHIVSVAGGELLLPLAMLAFTEPGCEVVTFDDGFQKFLNYTLTCGATPVAVPREADPTGAIQAALTPKTRIVLIDNPGNPTGWLLSPETIAEIHASLPSDVLLILDEAYVEFSSFGQFGLDLARDHRNVLTTRTFSKAYGLAGLRIGWAAGHRNVIEAVRRVIPTFPIPRPSLIGALAALGDVDHLASVTAEVGRIRDAAQTRLAAAGWDVAPSAANFLLIRAGRHAPEAVAEAVETLRAANILVRLLPRFRNAPAIRMTLGTAEDMARVYAALKI